MFLHVGKDRREYNWFCMQGRIGENTNGSASREGEYKWFCIQGSLGKSLPVSSCRKGRKEHKWFYMQGKIGESTNGSACWEGCERVQMVLHTRTTDRIELPWFCMQ